MNYKFFVYIFMLFFNNNVFSSLNSGNDTVKNFKIDEDFLKNYINKDINSINLIKDRFKNEVNKMRLWCALGGVVAGSSLTFLLKKSRYNIFTSRALIGGLCIGGAIVGGDVKKNSLINDAINKLNSQVKQKKEMREEDDQKDFLNDCFYILNTFDVKINAKQLQEYQGLFNKKEDEDSNDALDLSNLSQENKKNSQEKIKTKDDFSLALLNFIKNPEENEKQEKINLDDLNFQQQQQQKQIEQDLYVEFEENKFKDYEILEFLKFWREFKERLDAFKEEKAQVNLDINKGLAINKDIEQMFIWWESHREECDNEDKRKEIDQWFNEKLKNSNVSNL